MKLASKELFYNWKKYFLVEVIIVLMMFMVLLVDKLFKVLNIDNIIDQYPANLSGGERQRVAIARAY